MRWVGALALVVVGTGTPRAVRGQELFAMDTLSLHALPGVLVVVDSVDHVTQDAGLDSDGIRRRMIERLTDARIRVFTVPEWQVTLGNPVLYVALDLARVSPYLYLYRVDVELRQLAATVRDSSPVFVATWRAGAVLGSVGVERVGSLAETILAATDRFVRAHAEANRRGRPFDGPAVQSLNGSRQAAGRDRPIRDRRDSGRRRKSGRSVRSSGRGVR